MKFVVAFPILVFAVAITPSAFGQGSDHALSLPSPGSYSTTNTGIGSSSKNMTGSAASGTPAEGEPVEGDDSLYRGRTSETENPMLREEGPLHFKTRPKEKIHEVDSLKNLQTTAPDPKFQGSLAISGVSSVTKVAEKANEPGPAEPQKPAGESRESADDSRFVRRHLTFNAQGNEEPKKAETDSSPSPTPSPSASPAKKSSGAKP